MLGLRYNSDTDTPRNNLIGDRGQGANHANNANDKAKRRGPYAGAPHRGNPGDHELAGKVFSFGSAIRYRRTKLGLTQDQLAEAIGLPDRSTITRLEQRADPPSDKERIDLLAETLLGTREEILSGFVPANFPAHGLVAADREHDPLEALRAEVYAGLDKLAAADPDELVKVALRSLALKAKYDAQLEARHKRELQLQEAEDQGQNEHGQHAEGQHEQGAKGD